MAFDPLVPFGRYKTVYYDQAADLYFKCFNKFYLYSLLDANNVIFHQYYLTKWEDQRWYPDRLNMFDVEFDFPL